LHDLLDILSDIPAGNDLTRWFASLYAMPFGRPVLELVSVFFQLVGVWVFCTFLYRWIFGRPSHLEKWFSDNAANVATIAKHLARYHIAHAVPEPGYHLRCARGMLRLAHSYLPNDNEAREMSSQFDAINATLQGKLIQDGGKQIAWNSATGRSAAGGGEALLPLVTTFRGIARWCFDKGMWRLMSIFADHASDLAQQCGRALRRIWCEVEREAAFYQNILGYSVEALKRVDHVLAQAHDFLSSRDTAVLDAQMVRASVLRNLGRYGEALAKIDAFAPIVVEVKGMRHPDTLNTRYLRASVPFTANIRRQFALRATAAGAYADVTAGWHAGAAR
jgi:hypothetical protein